MTEKTAASPGRRRPRDRKHQIVLAASRQFRDKGYHNVSMSDVAAEVGITAGALYRHFAGKQELLFSAVSDGLAHVQAIASDAADLDAFIAATGRSSLERRGLPVLWSREARHLSADKRAALRPQLAAVESRVRDLLARERPDLDDADVDLVSWALIAALGSSGLHRISLSKHEFLRVHAGIMRQVVQAPLGTTADTIAPAPAHDRYTGIGLPRREQLIDHAIRLFDERGFQSVRMDDVGAAEGITGSSVYKHFSTKEELLATAIRRGDEQLRAGMSRALTEGSDSAEVRRILLRSHTDFALGNSRLIGMLSSERAELPDKERRVSERVLRDYLGVWTDVLRDENPALTPEVAKMMVDTAFTVTNNLVRMRLLRERRDLGDRILDINSSVMRYAGPTSHTD
ncbi:TetR/AcrR family transcriptional regulator [Tsukamurella ocularis]|uniref:TetR/AcrR family transcriptional regulator n=1 Tax=Tsukamurella ocularis TaxID=1970234 RepID=UPI0039EFC962